MALYTVSFISYGATLVFYAAAFPRLARNTAHAHALRDKYDAGEINTEEYEVEESMEKNRISNISTVSIICELGLHGSAVLQTHSNVGFIFVLCLNLSILLPLASDPKVNNYTLMLTNAYWVVLGIWWCKLSRWIFLCS